MVPIPVALSYRTSLMGRVPKLVRCEVCGYEYVYLLEATAQGQATSVLFLDNEGAQARSQAQAAADLQSTLQHSVEVVPCSACGHIQTNMFSRARELRYGWMRLLGVALAAVGAVLMTISAICLTTDTQLDPVSTASVLMCVCSAGALSLGFGLILGRLKMNANYDPNTLPEDERKRSGAEQSVSRAEFMQIQEFNRGALPPPAESGFRSHD